MFAATASATCLPALSLIALATSSQACCLREEITTLAPCSAMRSAMARPIPRDEPVMTATFPDISNRLMRLLQFDPAADAPVFISVQLSSVRAIGQPDGGAVSGQFAGGRDFRSGRLVHRIMGRIGHPGLLVDHRHPPTLM